MTTVWILYAYDHPDAPILESFDSDDNGPPTQLYVQEMFGHGVLYEYDLDANRGAVNPRLVTPCASMRRSAWGNGCIICGRRHPEIP